MPPSSPAANERGRRPGLTWLASTYCAFDLGLGQGQHSRHGQERARLRSAPTRAALPDDRGRHHPRHPPRPAPRGGAPAGLARPCAGARSEPGDRAPGPAAAQARGLDRDEQGRGNAGCAPLQRLSGARPRARVGPYRVVAPHPHSLRASGHGAGLGAVRPFAPRAGRAGLPGGCVRGAPRRRGARRLAPRVWLPFRLPPAARDAGRATHQARHPGRPGRAPRRERGAAGARPDHAGARGSGRPARRRDAVVRGGPFALPGAPGAARGRAAGWRGSRARPRSSARFSKSRSSPTRFRIFTTPRASFLLRPAAQRSPSALPPRASSSSRTRSTPTFSSRARCRRRSRRLRRHTWSTSARSPRRSSRACGSGGSPRRRNSSIGSRRSSASES